jgi:hypothetical protein
VTGFRLQPTAAGYDLVPLIRPDAFQGGTVDRKGVVTFTLERVPVERDESIGSSW